jgi:hypothetical protein
MLEAPLGRPLHPLIGEVVHPEMIVPDGGVACRVRGLPMGQPIASVIANLYLGEMDRALQGLPGSFYARYGDDFLFAHPDPAVVREAEAVIDGILGRLWLTVNEKKRRRSYLNAAGRPSEAWPLARGATAVPFLGTRIAAEGTIGLDPSKIKAFLREIDRRTAATIRTLRGAPRDDVARAVCSVVNRAVDPRSALTQHRVAILLRRVVTDRRQLEQLDYTISAIVAQGLAGRAGPRAFRKIPRRALRDEYGLISLVAARNASRAGRRRRRRRR